MEKGVVSESSGFITGFRGNTHDLGILGGGEAHVDDLGAEFRQQIYAGLGLCMRGNTLLLLSVHHASYEDSQSTSVSGNLGLSALNLCISTYMNVPMSLPAQGHPSLTLYRADEAG